MKHHLWETNVKNGRRNPAQNLFWSNSHWPKKPQGNCETNGISVHLPVRTELFGEPLQKTSLGGESHVLPRTQQGQTCHFAQDLYMTFTMAEDQSESCWEKCKKRVAELGGKFKEVMGEPSTEPFGSPKRICPTILAKLKPGWTFHRAFRDGSFWHPKTDLCWRSRDTGYNLGRTLAEPSAPEGQKHHKTCPSLVHPCWRNLGGTFHGTLWRPKTDLLQRTIKSPKGILPRHLYYGLRPQSRCRWVEK